MISIIAAIQVCYQLDEPKTKQREIKGLRQTCQTFKSVPGFIITYENEEPIEGMKKLY